MAKHLFSTKIVTQKIGIYTFAGDPVDNFAPLSIFISILLNKRDDN